MQGTCYDAVVVGGGPIGGRVARDIARAGFTVAILERSNSVGEPVQCSGLVTRRTLDLAEISPSVASNALTGAAVHAPGGERFEIGGDRVHAFVLDRRSFDRLVVGQAADAGVDLHLGTRVAHLERAGRGVQVHAERRGSPIRFNAPIVVGADGPRSIVADFLKLPPATEILHARGAEAVLPRLSGADQIQIFTGSRYAPGFFAWAIPLGGRRYRIGWGGGTSRCSANPLASLAEDFPDVFGGIEILSHTGGLIPVGPRQQTSRDNGMVVGDAAGHAKATSGGGLYTGLRCAEHCARVAIDALQAGNVSADALAAYDRAWQQDIGRELSRATALRNAFRQMSDDDLTWALRLLDAPGVRQAVDRFGDIDFPSRLATAVMPITPGLLRFLRGQQRWLSGLVPNGPRPISADKLAYQPALVGDGDA